VIKGLVQEMLAYVKCTLRVADKALCDLKAAHHAACVENLADEASEVLDEVLVCPRMHGVLGRTRLGDAGVQQGEH
jgi:hypothetical protein